MTAEATYSPREAVEGAITALEGRWSSTWIDALRVAALLIPDRLEWEEKYGLKDRTYSLHTLRIDADGTVGVGKAEDGSYVIRCTRPEEDGAGHVEQMALSPRAMLALMYLYCKFEDIPWESGVASHS